MIFYLSILILSSFYICLFWKFLCLAWMVKKFELWRTPILVPQTFCQILSFFHICLCILKIVMCLAYTSKKCKFWHPHLRGAPIVVLPNFVKFYLFIFAYSEKFHQSRVSGSVLNFGVLVWGGPFMCLAYVVKISCVWHTWLKSLSFFGPPFEEDPQILSFLYIYLT